MTRRNFVKGSTALSAVGLATLSAPHLSCTTMAQTPQPIQIRSVNANFEREALLRPFGFKGSAMTEVWQTIAFWRVRVDNGRSDWVHKMSYGRMRVSSLRTLKMEAMR